jgi:tetratricopeptide (TPR) repeat protein
MTETHREMTSLNAEAASLRESEPEKSIALAMKAAELARKEGLLQELAQSLLCIGIAEFRLSNFQKSALVLAEAHDLLEQCHADTSEVLFWLGRAHDRIGNYSLALEIHLKALERLEGKGETKELAQVYSQIGAVHLHLNAFEKALNYYFKALDIYDKQGNTQAQWSIYNNIGVIFRKNGSYDEALTYLKKVSFSPKASTTLRLSRIPCIISEMLKNSRQLERSRRLFPTRTQTLGKCNG